MEIDTLFLSGGGINCISLLGVFKYLFDNKIIQPNFKGIKNIVCVSGSSFFTLPFLLGFSLDAVIKICLECNSEKFIDYSNFDFNNIFEEYGFYDISFLESICAVLLKHKGLSEEITLQELYNHTNINWVLKTTNLTNYHIEYLNHKNNPDLSIIQAIKMTSCIPIIFKPVKYNDNYYVDGGLCGNYPIEYNKKLKSKKYLGIQIKSGDKTSKITNIFDFLNRLHMAPTSPYDDIYTKKKNRIIILLNHHGYIFKRTREENMKVIYEGYDKTEMYFNDYKHNHSNQNENED